MLLRLLQAEELDGLLLRVSDVLATSQDGGELFESATRSWLGDVETALQNNRMPLAARVASAGASLRISLHAAGRSAGGSPRRPSRKDKAAGCVRAIEQVVSELSAALAETHGRLIEAELACRRVIAIAQHKGLVGTVDPNSPDRLQRLMAVFRADQDVSAGVVQMTALVGTQDSLIVLSRRLDDIE